MDAIMDATRAKGSEVVNGEAAFELYDTFGFPFDLTLLIAKEIKLSVDEKGFEACLNEQKERSRAATSVETEDWISVAGGDEVDFIGYDNLEADVKITKYRKVTQKKKSFYQLVFNQTPFYAEGGGQVGDKGYIENGAGKVAIFDTKKENNLIVHLSTELPKDVETTFKAVVNETKRNLSASNHSATHLLHHALREVLGDHVEQKGSLVNDKYLRFDFSHFSKLTDEEVEKIEAMVTQQIRANVALDEKRAVAMEEAQNMGAMALFGEKYGDKVRVIKFGDSVELCGGTHVGNTGEIGLFKITSEGAVAAGVRRIEAITNAEAENFYKDKANTVAEVASY